MGSRLDVRSRRGRPRRGGTGVNAAVTGSPNGYENLLAWWDASDATTITESSGAVSEWADKSGNGYDLDGTGHTPTTGTRTQNGLNVIDFDSASSDYFDGGDVLDLALNDRSVFAVYKMDTSEGGSGGQGVIVKSLAGAGDGRWGLTSLVSNTTMIYVDGGDRNASYTDGATDVRVMTGQIDRTNEVVSLRKDGSAVGTDATSWTDSDTNYNTAHSLLVGAYPDGTGTAPLAGYYLNGFVAELIVFEDIKTGTEIDEIETYLADKWGITI